ncbi:MAG: hypothetical protein ACI837_002052 [Crocinitomicaceae bacterium]|jgi:hypothetical protein
MSRKMGIKALMIGLFVFASGMTFAQNMTPKKANQKMKNQGFVIIKHEYKTTEFIQQVKGARLVEGKLIAGENFRVIEGKGSDVLINAVSCVTVEHPDGSSVTQSCGCTGGGGSCDVQADGAGEYSCSGDECCSLITVTVSAGGKVGVER